MADPLPYIIILASYIKMLGKKVSQAENSHIYGYVYVCLCVSVKKKLIFILLPSALQRTRKDLFAPQITFMSH